MKKKNLIIASIVCLFSTGCVLPKLPEPPILPGMDPNIGKPNYGGNPMGEQKIISRFPDGRIVTQGNMNYGKKCVLMIDTRTFEVTETGVVIRDVCVPNECKKWYDNLKLQPKNADEEYELKSCKSDIVYKMNKGYILVR